MSILLDMTLEEGTQRFVEAWGTFATHWGINRTMAQVHALLLISARPLHADAIMETLKISRGNANMNLRALVDWGLIHKHLIPGERREYFVAEKDIWLVIRQIIIHRKKKELEPVLRVLSEVSQIEGGGQDEAEFRRVIQDIMLFAHKANKTLDGMVESDSKWFVGTFMKMIR